MLSTILCEEIKKLSEQIYDFITNVESVQEESITEYLVWKCEEISDLTVHFMKSDSLKLHTKTEEAKSGADFELELWIIREKEAIPFLIQAKKIIKHTNSYCVKSLNYDKKKTKKQYELLLERASKEKKVPYYVFYTKKSKTETIYISEAEEVKTLAEKCLPSPPKKRSDTVTSDDILDISTNILDYCCDEYIEKAEGLISNYKVELGKLPRHIQYCMNNAKDDEYSRDVLVLDVRNMQK